MENPPPPLARLDRINSTIRRILEGCVGAKDPAAYVLECIAILRADMSWGTEDIAEVQFSALLIVKALRGH